MIRRFILSRWIQAGILAGMVLVAYLPSTDHSFIWDDDYYITHNMTLAGFSGLKRIWLEPGATPQYYPLVFTSFWLEYHLFGLNPAVFHFTNILLHAANAVLVWLILARLRLPWAWPAAALFALHPVNVESVAWISERKNVLSGMFVLLSLLFLIRASLSGTGGNQYPETASTNRRLSYMTSFLFFIPALLSKTVTCMMPAAFLMLVWWKNPQGGGRKAVATLPFFLVGAAAALHTVIMEKSHVGAYGMEWAFSTIDRVLIAGRALWFYAYKLVWPANLVFIYPRWDINATVWWQYLFPVGALGAFILLWVTRGRLGRGALTGVAIFATALFPALGFINYYPMRYSFVADHFQYMAGIALIALITAAAHRLFHGIHRFPAKTACILFSVLLLLLGTRTLQEQNKYENLHTLWRDTLRKDPLCWMAHNNVGALLSKIGNYEKAIAHFNKSLSIYPTNVMAHLNIKGVSKKLTGQTTGPLLYAGEPGRPRLMAWDNRLATVMTRLGWDKAANHYYQKVMAVDPRNAEAHYGTGQLLERQGKIDAAITAYETTLDIDPLYTDVYQRLGKIHLTRNEYEKAIDRFFMLLKIDPFRAEAFEQLGLSYYHTGDLENAIRAYRLALNIQPHNRALQMTLSRILTQPEPVESLPPRP
ncbi:tetratricopeptide repeat protein [Desulfosudis oleivorans]|uniref:Tetratricopeptide TPR_2 repeat protein n=1 Tax=Desulfosudis oleivorans (strain DSM 6200 / JCM 39069 / Hxd3) TaxID=96561 RepID=A8ZVM7_DESOH|nr:tetratricopeptide repeat protein [Desulfosudis oleivorans]ABW68214.1 Tetratricopeptide TPR_2 repeat protein [Desulfosudis oleivorans Hxd3]